MATQQDPTQASNVISLEAYKQRHEHGVVAEVSHAQIAEGQAGEVLLFESYKNNFGVAPRDPEELATQPEPNVPMQPATAATATPEMTSDPATNYHTVIDFEAKRSQAKPQVPEYDLAHVRASINAAYDEVA